MMHKIARGALAACLMSSMVVSAGRAEAQEEDRAPEPAPAATKADLFGRRGSVVLDNMFGVFVASAAPASGLGGLGFTAGWISLAKAGTEGGSAGTSDLTTVVLAP